MITKNKYKFKTGAVELLGLDTLLVSYKKGAELGVEDAEAVREIRKKLIGDRTFFNVMDMSKGLLKISSEAKAWMAVNKDSGSLREADIIVVSSFFMKIKVLSYLFFFKPKVKTYTAASKEKALKLVEHLKSKNVNKVAAAA